MNVVNENFSQSIYFYKYLPTRFDCCEAIARRKEN